MRIALLRVADEVTLGTPGSFSASNFLDLKFQSGQVTDVIVVSRQDQQSNFVAGCHRHRIEGTWRRLVDINGARDQRVTAETVIVFESPLDTVATVVGVTHFRCHPYLTAERAPPCHADTARWRRMHRHRSRWNRPRYSHHGVGRVDVEQGLDALRLPGEHARGAQVGNRHRQQISVVSQRPQGILPDGQKAGVHLVLSRTGCHGFVVN
ncbi:MAG: hypothetical protein Ct9H300mP1_17690 [Planctomycetaceae bacterium]|nr:MAG: hypothetical protein Ct9H300mP1_17690 [Planctomycetaceae bacterium]